MFLYPFSHWWYKHLLVSLVCMFPSWAISGHQHGATEWSWEEMHIVSSWGLQELMCSRKVRESGPGNTWPAVEGTGAIPGTAGHWDPVSGSSLSFCLWGSGCHSFKNNWFEDFTHIIAKKALGSKEDLLHRRCWLWQELSHALGSYTFMVVLKNETKYVNLLLEKSFFKASYSPHLDFLAFTSWDHRMQKSKFSKVIEK